MKNRYFFCMAILVVSLQCSCAQKEIQKQKPNIIFIMSDDHAYQAISAYNSRLKTLAPTPNIDRIAKQGMRFDRYLVTNSICGPSRAVLLTGKYSHINGFMQNNGTDFNGSQETFPKLFQQAGYETAVIGKWHLGSTPTGFSHWEILNDQGQYYNPEFINTSGKHIEHGYVTDLITEKSLAWLKQVKIEGKPFMLMIHHKAPHREWEPNLKYLGIFKDVLFPEPDNLFDNYQNRGAAAHDQKMTISNDMRIASDLKVWGSLRDSNYQRTRARLDSAQGAIWDAYYDPVRADFEKRNLQRRDLVRWKYQRYLQDYLACIRSVDESVGEILDWLAASGLDKNTMVVYTSDQVFYLGEHGWFDKRFMYEESYRTPLLIQWPGMVKPGSVNRDMVSNLDWAETLLDVCGMKIPEDMQGQSMVPLLQGNTPADWRKEHYYHYYEYPGPHSVKKHYGISTSRYVLIHFYDDVDEWEMYDLKTDPEKMKNIYNDPEYMGVRKLLTERLRALRIRYKDTGDAFQ